MEGIEVSMKNAEEIYKDIIGLPRPTTTKTPMSNHDRAAQFAPFAALTGYDKVIKKATDINLDTPDRIIVDPDQIDPDNMLYQ